jgi:hypothetical protein
VLAVVAAHYFFTPHINLDEIEHAHVIWGLSQGVIPYRDLHQPHMPLLWMLAWPLMNWLPWTAGGVLALRTASAAALVGSYLGGLLLLRELCGAVRGVHALLLLLLVLAVVPDFQLYMFRPDPFMTFFSVWAIVAAARMRRAPAQYSFLCGAALGVAASFSVRLSWLCFLVPLASLWECCRQRTLRPLWLVVPNAAGFLLGILPVAAWILAHGVLDKFWSWVITVNSGSIHIPFQYTEPETVLIHRLLAALAALGGVWLLCSQWRAAKQAWPPSSTVLIAAALAWMVPMMNPIHLVVQDNHYNFAVVMIPGAVLGTVFTVKLLALNTRAWQLRLAAVALLFGLIELQTPAQQRPGASLDKAELHALGRLCSGPSATCIGFAPFHPVFCRDAVDLYLMLDELIVNQPFYSQVAQRYHKELWPDAIAAVEQGKPNLIVDWATASAEQGESLVPDRGMWAQAHLDKVLSDDEYQRFRRAIKTLYDLNYVGGRRVYTRKTNSGSNAN